MNSENNALRSKSLSIQLCSDGFSFCIYDTETGTYEKLEVIDFETPITLPDALYKRVKQIFEQNELLQQEYNEVMLIHHNEINTFVPSEYFDEKILNKYLDKTVKIFDNDFITYDDLITLSAKNVYVPFVNINNFIFENFGAFTFLHSSTVFVKNILDDFYVSEKEMFINVYQNNFQLLVLEYNQLVLFNTFQFNTPEDFVYYILFVSEQLKMDNNEFKLTLLGEVDTKDDNYKLLYNYIRNIVIYKKEEENTHPNIKVENHKHYNLLNLHS